MLSFFVHGWEAGTVQSCLHLALHRFYDHTTCHRRGPPVGGGRHRAVAARVHAVEDDRRATDSGAAGNFPQISDALPLGNGDTIFPRNTSLGRQR